MCSQFQILYIIETCKKKYPRFGGGVRTPPLNPPLLLSSQPHTNTHAYHAYSASFRKIFVLHVIPYLIHLCFEARSIRNTKNTLYWPSNSLWHFSVNNWSKGARCTESNRTIWRELNTSMAHGQVIGSKQSQPSDKRNARGCKW